MVDRSRGGRGAGEQYEVLGEQYFDALVYKQRRLPGNAITSDKCPYCPAITSITSQVAGQCVDPVPGLPEYSSRFVIVSVRSAVTQEPHPDVAYGQVDTKQHQGRLQPNSATPWSPHHPIDRASAPHPVYTQKVVPAPVCVGTAHEAAADVSAASLSNLAPGASGGETPRRGHTRCRRCASALCRDTTGSARIRGNR